MFSKLLAKLQNYNQTHLLNFFDSLSPSEQQSLLTQIETLDLELIQQLSKNLLEQDKTIYHTHKIAPLDAVDLSTASGPQKEEWEKIGRKALQQGQVAALVVAGGLGTRLGYPGPKGIMDIGLPSKKSLFTLQAQRVQALGKEVQKEIPWYIMTSPNNHTQTIEHFKKHAYFNLNPNNVTFFSQEQLPAVDETGKILMESKSSLALSPNGNGGCFLALEKSGALNDMKQRGIQYVFFYSVDNALVQVADPLFIGYMIEQQAPTASKVVAKTRAEEKVGLLTLYNEKPSIIEYSDMPEQLLNSKNSAGELEYNNGNIAIHCFQLDFLETYGGSSLPYHKAHKKISCIDSSGNIQKSSEANGYKFELFMFDLFPFASSMATLRVPREEEFAPIKNKEGVDSPESARHLMAKLHAKTGRKDLI